MIITIEQLREIADLTVRLTELRQNECKHLSIENFSPEIFGMLLREFRSVFEESEKTQEAHMEKVHVITEAEQARLDNNFTYHAPKGDQAERYEAIQAKAKELAAFFMEHCPPSRELSIALTHVEEAVYSANAAIARNE